MFWFLAIAIVVGAAVGVCWPLLRTGGLTRSAGFGFVAVGIIFSLLLYREIGTPAALNVDGRPSPQANTNAHSPDQEQMGDLLAQLEQRLQQNPDDLEGWVILGRSYKTMQRYAESVAALNEAYRLAPGNALVIVELAEARMFASGNPLVGDPEIELLEKALEIDPRIQKGLWLMGISAAQSGLDETAADYWQQLLVQLEPGSDAALAIQERIDELQGQGGTAPALPGPWPGIQIQVSGPSETFQAAPGSVLFVIARRPGGGGPPLGVKRIENPQFPVSVLMADSDSMMPQVPVSSIQTVELLARLSLTGQPVAGEGDVQSNLMQVSTEDPDTVRLQLGMD